MSDMKTRANGVPKISRKRRRRNYHDPKELRQLIAALWLYIGYYEETQLTTEQKELLADVVERTSSDDDQISYDRWWRR